MTSPPQGWYPSPDNPNEQRWWDGAAWTDQRRPLDQPDPTIIDPVPTAAAAVPVAAPEKLRWWRRRVPVWGVALIAFASMVIGGAIVQPDQDEAQRAHTVDTTTTTTTKPSTTTTRARATTTTTAGKVAVTVTSTSTTTATTVRATSTTARGPRMPNVVCRNLQDAQNDIQHAGVFYSRSEDATGQGRNQIIDSNWIVVRQTPAPGKPFGEGDALLYVVRTDEPNDCHK